MQITINTDTDDLPAVIRMLQAYAPPRKLRITNSKDETVAELTASSVKFTNDPIDITDPTRTYTGCFNVEDYTQGSDIQGPATVLRAGKQIATFPEGIYRGVFFDEPDHKIEIPGTPADQIDTGAALQAAVPPPCSAHAQEDDEPTPERVFAAPKSLFDSVPDVAAELAKGPSATVSDVTVDAAGLPWDARIHSGAKTKLANGSWKLLRGVDPALVASVEAELRGDPKPANTATETAGSTTTTAPAIPATVPVAPPAAPNSPPPPPAPPAVSAAPKPITNAAELVAAVMDKRFTTDQVNAACRAVGIDNVASLLAKQDKLPEVLRELGV